MPIRAPRGRRLGKRRAWALHTLRLHVDDGGTCAFCAGLYDRESPWPCVPASIALLYVGQTKR